MSEEFPISITKYINSEDITSEGGKGENREIRWKGVDSQGLVINISVKGAKQLMETKFVQFPQGTGVNMMCILKSVVKTTTQLIQEANAEAEAEKKPEIKPVSISDIEKEI
ncbi:MAG: hypothetical protein NT116_00725, partial [Candidatus Parcubacteria bacterium]|nr:hypothetical protein [Candidatus Parcubacteria bacterium]